MCDCVLNEFLSFNLHNSLDVFIYAYIVHTRQVPHQMWPSGSLQTRKCVGEKSTLDLKPMRKDTLSPKQEQSVAPQKLKKSSLDLSRIVLPPIKWKLLMDTSDFRYGLLYCCEAILNPTPSWYALFSKWQRIRLGRRIVCLILGRNFRKLIQMIVEVRSENSSDNSCNIVQ